MGDSITFRECSILTGFYSISTTNASEWTRFLSSPERIKCGMTGLSRWRVYGTQSSGYLLGIVDAGDKIMSYVGAQASMEEGDTIWRVGPRKVKKAQEAQRVSFWCTDNPMLRHHKLIQIQHSRVWIGLLPQTDPPSLLFHVNSFPHVLVNMHHHRQRDRRSTKTEASIRNPKEPAVNSKKKKQHGWASFFFESKSTEYCPE